MTVHEELVKLAEILPRLKKRNPYKVPQGYFSNLGQTINKKLTLEGEFDYRVPENYFEQLPDTVMGLVKLDATSEKENIFPVWMKYASVAASFLILVFVGSLIINPSSTSTESSFESEYLEYLSENIVDIEASSLIDLDILEDDYVIQGFNAYDDSVLDFYLENNLDDIELAYLEDIIE